MLFLLICCGTIGVRGQSTINNSNKWAWSAGAGWINCRTDSTNGAVIGEFVCSGYFYSSTVGWIDLGRGNPTNGIYYTNGDTNDYGVNHDGKGHLTGYAWCESSGWINFEWTNAEAADAPKVDMQTGAMSGYAWGGSLGWISLSNLSAYLQTDTMASGSDGNTNNIPDAWELTEAGDTNLLGGGTNDYDGDGITDYYEYVAGTSPTNSNDYLQLTGVSVTGGTNIQLTWASEETRLYKVEWREDLISGSGWTDLGTFSPDTGNSTTETIPGGSDTQGFYRIKAMLPLSE